MVNLPTAGTDYHVPFGGRGVSSLVRVNRDALPPSSLPLSRPPTWRQESRNELPD